MKKRDLSGQRFGRLTVQFGFRRNKRTYWRCICDCGNEKDIFQSSLLRGLTNSCGCLQNEIRILTHTTHGASKTRLYKIFCCMLKRCYNEKASNYERYGGRGIRICDEWHNNFLTFQKWALSHGYNDNLSIDRINPNDNYYPENCRWVDDTAQTRNRRNTAFLTFQGVKKPIAEWAVILGIKRATLARRIRTGMAIEKAMTGALLK
jgi:hypothetical protein